MQDLYQKLSKIFLFNKKIRKIKAKCRINTAKLLNWAENLQKRKGESLRACFFAEKVLICNTE